jgi:hypothetical protein
MKALILSLLLVGSVTQAADSCPRYCNPEKSKPCGAGCISKDLTCRKDWTTSCVGVRENKKVGYSTPKFVSQRPE